MSNILVLAASDMTDGLRGQMESYMRKAQIPMVNVRFAFGLTNGCIIKTTKTRVDADPSRESVFAQRLTDAIRKYAASTIIINDWVALKYITQKYSSLALTRGSTYFVNGLPAIVVDSLRTKDGGAKLRAVPHAAWLLQQDLKKVNRWFNGKQQREPRFDYRVVKSLDELDAFARCAASSVAIAMDIETTGRGQTARISCSGYACIGQDGAIRSWVIPFIDPFGENGHAWSASAFESVLRTLRDVHASSVPKVLQNGAYDSHYYIRYRIPPKNFLLDTAIAWHSIWPELPKRLDFITSIAVDHYRYWKDEKAVDANDDDKASKIPTSRDGWDRYLRYNAMDCHYTALDSLYLLRVMSKIPWAMDNYRQSFRQQLGPAIAMSLRGVRTNAGLKDAFEIQNTEESRKVLKDLRVMTATPEFNPNANEQVATLLYDIMGAEPLKQRGAKAKKKKTDARPVDEKTLQIFQTQHWLLDRIITSIWGTKKPANNAAKYGPGLKLWNSRWLYALNATGTETGRYSCSHSNFWIGQQIQNVPYPMRALVEPDDGYVLFEFDYSKADFWHTAFASEEPEMMRVCLDTSLDLHCYHASKFFSRPYEEIYAGYKAKDPVIVDSLHGIRQNTKRVVYGANYMMAGYTMFITMGKEAVDATARYMDYDTNGWSINDYAKFCQSLIDFYYSTMYPGMMPWLERTVMNVSRKANLAVCAGGKTRSFFANLLTDNGAQRELAAFYGQGGTAMTINRVLDNVYYGGLDSQDLHILTMTHDSITGQIKLSALDRLVELKQAMEVVNEIHGRQFVIPVEGSVGFGWGFRMTDWHENITVDEIRKADEKWKAKNQNLMSLIGKLAPVNCAIENMNAENIGAFQL